MKRTIQTHPQYTITKSGKVWLKHEAVPPFTVRGQYGLVHLAVRLDGERHFVWKLLSDTWYDGALILTRDGGLLNWNDDNVIKLNLSPGEKFSTSVIQWIWFKYQHERILCVSMSVETGLAGYSIDEYRRLIEEILISSVR